MRTHICRLFSLLAALATLLTIGFPSAAQASGPNRLALERSARLFAPSAEQAAAAHVLVKQLAAREAALKAPGAYQASPVIGGDGGAWLVLEGASAAIGVTSEVNASPYPAGIAQIYRWSAAGWKEQADVRGYFGPIGGCCGISAVSLTGSADPDFALTGGGAADTNWLAVLSDVGGRWHAVPFQYGYSYSSVVNGEPLHHAVETAIDASSSATGPTTFLLETYQHGRFRPSAPSGRSAPCSLSALQLAADPGEEAVLVFSKFACADGWAMAIGTGAGYSDQVVGLFEQAGTRWSTIALDNGDSLGSDPGLYDLPLSLLRELTAGFGPAVRPALATAPLIARNGQNEALYLNGVISADGADWYVAETLTGSEVSPGANAEIYRWSGSAWVEQGRVDRVPRSLNYFYAVSGGWFEAVAVPGTRDPGFKMEEGGSASTEMLTDTGGTWHVAT
ncbi:MAG TPA: hypothetical protein VHM72_10725 [Solirubrobacteraceae bacterium]|nr:hypothetical protein [Solirubrobacteraceae bacterium]